MATPHLTLHFRRHGMDGGRERVTERETKKDGERRRTMKELEKGDRRRE